VNKLQDTPESLSLILSGLSTVLFIALGIIGWLYRSKEVDYRKSITERMDKFESHTLSKIDDCEVTATNMRVELKLDIANVIFEHRERVKVADSRHETITSRIHNTELDTRELKTQFKQIDQKLDKILEELAKSK
jgi:hypothetical protein